MFKKHKKLFIIGAVVLAAAIGVYAGMVKRAKPENTEAQVQVTRVVRGRISNVLEGSGTLEALDQYEVTSLVSGDVKRDFFEEGDMVNKGDIMYMVDDSAVEKNIKRAQNSLNSSKVNYNESVRAANDLLVYSTASGVVTEVFVKNGDNIQSGGRVCSVINNDKMTLKIPFLEQQASEIHIGQGATVELTGEDTVLYGFVTSVASGALTNSLGASVVSVEITVDNPGGITESTTATAVIGNVACAEVGTFEYSESLTVLTKAGGTVRGFDIKKGDRVSEGQLLLRLENESVTNSVQKSAMNLSDAELNLANYYDDLDQYNLTAPISGKVIQKTVKAGDKISANMGGTSMAIIADMSALKFSMSVDELDITNVKEGQKVTVTADAIPDAIFIGYVNNVGIVGTSANGVTTYPVEIMIDEVEGTSLIPGMNVTATVVLEEKDNVLLLPVTAIERGSRVTMSDTQEQKEVKTGINDGNMIEIISGLSEGDEVIIKEFQTSSLMQRFGNMSGGMMGGGMMGGGMPGGGMPSGGMRSSGMSGSGMRSSGMSGGGMSGGR